MEGPTLVGSLTSWASNALSYILLIGLAIAVWQSLKDRSTSADRIQTRARAVVIVTVASMLSTAVAVGIFLILAFGWGESSRPPPLWVQWCWYIVALAVAPTVVTLALARKAAVRNRRLVIVIGMVVAIVPEVLYFVIITSVLH